MAIKRNKPHPDEPLRHPDHPRPVTRREFIQQGFLSGTALTIGGNLLNLMVPQEARAAISPDVEALVNQLTCSTGFSGGGKIPFIAFDLAGGTNFAGSNIPVGGPQGQMDTLDADGYRRQGLRADQIPTAANTNNTLGLTFHNESALFAGIMSKVSATTASNINGVVIAARSDNDTGNNPHNPMYGIARTGAFGGLVSLIGSRATDSGGNSMAPANLIDLSIRPTKVDRPSDVVNMVDTGELVGVLTQNDAVSVMESVARISNRQIDFPFDTRLSSSDNDRIRELLNCGYVKAASIADQFGTTDAIDPSKDENIVPVTGSSVTPIFSNDEFNGTGASSGRDGSEFRKTAAVMKMVLDGARAGAGTITMGGYDYHTGDRVVGESRDFRAGVCMGACLEYAARKGLPLFLYAFSDGSVFSNGMEDPNAGGKLVWTGDNSSTAASFILVYDPRRQPTLVDPSRQQLGYYRPNGAVETASTPAANNVNILVDLVCLNYMALHNEVGQFPSLFPNNGLGVNLDALTAFDVLYNGTMSSPA